MERVERADIDNDDEVEQEDEEHIDEVVDNDDDSDDDNDDEVDDDDVELEREHSDEASKWWLFWSISKPSGALCGGSKWCDPMVVPSLTVNILLTCAWALNSLN